MKIILNDHPGSTSFGQALKELVQGADTLSVAVSYLQVGGWYLFRKHTEGLSLPKMRLLCTDQLAITPPAAVRLAQSSGIQIRNYSGNATYHPKVYMAHNRTGQPTRFLLGSSNLSHSAFTGSIEAGVLSTNGEALSTLNNWFNNLFTHRSSEFTAASLQTMEEKWRSAAASRARARLLVRSTSAPPFAAPLATEDIDTVEDVFSSIQLPIGLLNMDYAANNIRSVSRVRVVLANWDSVKDSETDVHSKHRSELKLLGFAQKRNLTPLGIAARAAGSEEAVARLWCAWVQETADSDLAETNKKLLIAKRVFSQFWRLKPEVRNYFLTNAENPPSAIKATLQRIELLCNASSVVQEFSLSDIEALAPILAARAFLPAFVRSAVDKYEVNKGERTWGPDRRIVPLAWKAVLG